jgi:2-polyprenyl-3-methyl-5-hydroxy-6-metoxy-1,4-benzoquinol methylase
MSTQNSINQLFNNNSKSFGDTIEQQYHTGFYRRGDVFLNKVTSHVKKQYARILDYGCGTGRISLILGTQGYQVTGVDPAIEHLKRAEELNHLPNVKFQLLNDNDSLGDVGSYDAVVSSSVFEFVPDAQLYIKTIAKLLPSGGILIISFPNLFSLWRIYSKIRFRKVYNHFSFQKNMLSNKEIRTLMEQSDFRLLKGPQYYESAFDHKGLGFLNASRLFGTLGVWVFEKK